MNLVSFDTLGKIVAVYALYKGGKYMLSLMAENIELRREMEANKTAERKRKEESTDEQPRNDS